MANLKVRQLVQVIKNADYLNDEQKEKLLDLIIKLEIKDLKLLAGFVLWCEKQRKRLQREKEFIVASVAEFFAAWNKAAAVKMKKDFVRKLEEKDTFKSTQRMEDLLKNISDA